MTIRLIQILCIALTSAILYGLGKSLDLIGSQFGSGFDAGFVIGMIFMGLLYGLICWIDPSSRPRGAAGKQQRPNDRVH